MPRSSLDASPLECRGDLVHGLPGTIVAISRFAKGAVEAAFAQGAAPITLIDGDRLIDLLIEHGIGVWKGAIEVLTFDPARLSSVDGADGEH